MEIVVPAYFSPSSGLWGQLNTAATQVEITAIMNPNSGPGSSRSTAYVNAVDSLRAAGGKVIGYVSSSYGARPLSLVTADIDRYAEWYGIDGIFIDEMSNTNVPAQLDHYQTIYNYVKSKNAAWEVMGNPGTTTLEPYLSRPTADRLMVFENLASTYPGYVPSSWNLNYDSSSFVHLVHDQASAAGMMADVDRARGFNAGAIYVTNDVLNNPWDTLPSYWNDLVAKAAATPSLTRSPAATLSNPVRVGALAVDAARTDWAVIAPFPVDTDSAPLPGPQLDFREVQFANDSTNLFARLQLNQVGGVAPPTLGFRHNVFLDTDLDRTTGYSGSSGALSVGADYLVQGSVLYRFSGATPTSFTWTAIGALTKNDAVTTDIELTVPLALIGSPASIDFLVNAANTSTEDYLPNGALGGRLGAFFRYNVGAPPQVIGDYNGDGLIGTDDYAVWVSEFGTSGAAADGNSDGVVDAADYTVWRDAMGAAPALAAAAVPEPCGASIACAAMGSVLGVLTPFLQRFTYGPLPYSPEER